MAPKVMLVLSGTVSIERTSKPVVLVIDVMKGACVAELMKKHRLARCDHLADNSFPQRNF